ncbi:hypothetical protein ABPG75_006877 [Micractinium tetrahymenae]
MGHRPRCLPPCLISSLASRPCKQPLCLVCKRWERVLHSPALLRCLKIELKRLAALQSFGRWLGRPAAGRVGTLHLQSDLEVATDKEACSALFCLAGSVAACGAAGRLPELHLAVFDPSRLFTVGSWAPALGARLRSLATQADSTMMGLATSWSTAWLAWQPCAR